jgi:hypothetical protein
MARTSSNLVPNLFLSFVIDCVKAHHEPASPLYAPERFDVALKSILRLIEKCRAVGIPVVICRLSSKVLEQEESGTRRNCQMFSAAMVLEIDFESLLRVLSRGREKLLF